MPYTPPGQPELDAEQAQKLAAPANGPDRAVHPEPGRDPAREELQVRQTAQRLLDDHLRRPRGAPQDDQLRPPSPRLPFWPGISIDLTGATLVNFGFARVSVMNARFGGATFQGTASFGGTTFQGVAAFGGTTFQGTAWFSEATFQGYTTFLETTFRSGALFSRATFRFANFRGVTFEGNVKFDEATFPGDAEFAGAHVLHLDDLNTDRVWPDGWIARPDPTDPSRGTLVKG
jgi:pentapeptide repeat protein